MAAWKFALLSLCLMQIATSAMGDHERRLLQAPAPAPAPNGAPPVPPPGACLNDFFFTKIPTSQVTSLIAPCNAAGVATASKDCCENIQFIGLALLALNAESNSNIYAITSDIPAGQNAACVNDFNQQILAANGVTISGDVNTFCASYNVEVFPNIETTLQGNTCNTTSLQDVENKVDLNALATTCYAQNSCAQDNSGLTVCEDAVVLDAKLLAADPNSASEVAACSEVVSARLVQVHFYESYYSIIQDCGNGTANTALPPILEFAQSPTNNYSLPTLPPRAPSPAPAPGPTAPAPAPGPEGPSPAPAPGPQGNLSPPPPPGLSSPPPPAGAAASSTANFGLFFGVVLLIASIL